MITVYQPVAIERRYKMRVLISIDAAPEKLKTIEQSDRLKHALEQLKNWIDGQWAIDKIHNIESDDLHGKFYQIMRENEITCL